MSEKLTASAESATPLDPLQLALKKVYSVHKEKIKELTEEKEDFKEGCEVLLQHKARLLEKVRSLQNHNEVLYNENTRLRNLLDAVRSQDGRSGNCQTCDHLQRSLSAIQEAYKHSLDEKEKMIHYLEERVAELTRQSSPFNKQADLNLSNLLTPDKSINEGETSRTGNSHEKSPCHNRRNGHDKQGTASKKILEAVTNRLGREASQDHGLETDRQEEGYTNRMWKKLEEHIDDDISSLGRDARRIDEKTCKNAEEDGKKERMTSRHKYSQGQAAVSRSDSCSQNKSDISDKHHLQDRKQKQVYGAERSDAKLTEPLPETGHAVDECGPSSDEAHEKESPETLRQRKLGLGRNRGKRSRYTEDSPTGKKKQKLDKQVQNTSDKSEGPAHKQSASSRLRQRSHVLVQETCDLDSDQTVSTSSDGTPERVEKGRRPSVTENIADFGVVPETLGMGLTSSESESDDDMRTQNTVRVRTDEQSPGDVLNSPPSDIEADVKLNKVTTLLSRSNSRSISGEKDKLKDKPAAEREQQDISVNNLVSGSLENVNTDIDKGKKDKSDVSNDHAMLSRPSSPIFSGARGPRRSITSPFLFDDDGPGSSKSNQKKNVNISEMESDQESPLLLRPGEAVVHSTDYGQSPVLKDMSRSKAHGETGSGRYGHTNTECLSNTDKNVTKTRKPSQDQLQRSVKIRNLRTSEKLKQTTLSQVFPPSPPSLPFVNLSPTKPEERAAIDKAIRLSLQEIDTNKGIVKGMKPLFGKSKEKDLEANAGENVPPLFKKPPSPHTLKSPSKKNSPNKKSPPKQKQNRISLNKCRSNLTQKEDIADLDETVPPDSEALECLSKPKRRNQKSFSEKTKSMFSVNMLNESLNPDVSLAQYCSDTELLSQRRGHRTRRTRGLKAASQDIQSSLDAACTVNREETDKAASQDTLHCPVVSDSLSRNGGKNKNNRSSQGSNIGSQNKLPSLDEDDYTEPSTFRSSKNRSIDRRHFTPNEGVSLQPDDCLVTSGVSKPSSSVEILSGAPGRSLDIEGEENEADVTMDPRFMKAHMYEAQMEESQSIPLSSCSFKFGSSKSSKSSSSGKDEENQRDNADDDGVFDDEDENTLTEGRNDRRKSLNDSFDRVPQRQQADFAHVDVVRKRSERQQLKATTCQECYDYYKSKGCSEEEIHQQIQNCSRHRARYLPPSTPEHFWSIGFPDTQECEERGYIRKESPSKKKTGYRRRRQLTKRFKSREEEEGPDTETDTQT